MRNVAGKSLILLLALDMFGCKPRTTDASGKLAEANSRTWLPLPYEDSAKGKNSNAYEGYIGEKDQAAFIEKAKPAALQICREYKIPASAIVGMAGVESGYGSTRLGYKANNYFSTKVWGKNPPNSWQLEGQPDESMGSQDPTKVIKNMGYDRLIFDEANRADNRYRAFKTPTDSFRYLAEAFLKRPNKPGTSKGYINASDKWLKATMADKSDATLAEASKQYLADIADAGYCHLGGTYYRNHIGPVMDKFKLYELDRQCLTAEPVSNDLLTINEIKVFPTVDSDNQTAKGMVNIQVKVTDLGSGVDRVEFYAGQEADGGQGKGTDVPLATLNKPTDPVDSVFLIPWDTTKIGPDGTYNIVVEAYDKVGSYRLKTRTVTLKNGAAAAKTHAGPTAPASKPATGGSTAPTTSKPVNGNWGTCKANGRQGSCIDKAYCEGGTPVAGKCSGPASVMCCVW